MFDAIAPTYDVLNRMLSLGIDGWWRRRLIRSVGPLRGRRVLDVACGTGDVLLSLSRQGPAMLVGLDLAPQMLLRAERRLDSGSVNASLVTGAAEALPFPDATFDVVTVAFGVRNFEDLPGGLREIHRVLRPGGRLSILEFSRPAPGVWAWIFAWYFSAVLPRIGRWVSGHADAYTYLPQSVAAFPDVPALHGILQSVGFADSHSSPLAGGVATLTNTERPFPAVSEL